MTTIIATIVVLGILIFVHELGHFLLAELLGVRVDAFSLGFPPKLLSKKIGETEYRLSVVPLGGYVKLLGENPDEEVPPELEPRSFSHHPLWHRALIVVAGPGFNLLFCIVALFLLFSISGIPYLTTQVGDVKSNSPAALAGLQQGDRILTVGGKKVERWDELSYHIREHGERPLALTVKRGEQVLEINLTPQRMETTNIFGQKFCVRSGRSWSTSRSCGRSCGYGKSSRPTPISPASSRSSRRSTTPSSRWCSTPSGS